VPSSYSDDFPLEPTVHRAKQIFLILWNFFKAGSLSSFGGYWVIFIGPGSDEKSRAFRNCKFMRFENLCKNINLDLTDLEISGV
jgi:hypothetical protein